MGHRDAAVVHIRAGNAARTAGHNIVRRSGTVASSSPGRLGGATERGALRSKRRRGARE